VRKISKSVFTVTFFMVGSILTASAAEEVDVLKTNLTSTSTLSREHTAVTTVANPTCYPWRQ
jgi:hypothetical protein